MAERGKSQAELDAIIGAAALATFLKDASLLKQEVDDARATNDGLGVEAALQGAKGMDDVTARKIISGYLSP
jgi:hypothetical protein